MSELLVAVVGTRPTPAPRMLHQLAQSCRMSVTPFRPVSTRKCGAKPGIALETDAASSCTKFCSLFAGLYCPSSLRRGHGENIRRFSTGLNHGLVLKKEVSAEMEMLCQKIPPNLVNLAGPCGSWKRDANMEVE